MFKCRVGIKFKKQLHCFKPYKGNVQIQRQEEQRQEHKCFKPYKGNVQIIARK